ncbi:peptidoglycan DD-metalloendopeptidase family protein [Psychrosphaera ytuae]|uniref:Peptidoglycan DD-metalloendopeptidase family protein n=1 Tax=Psychrosphaera ytuae TaxID=2820710 RepID=A0A975HHX0_9GAMM|nr:M23 family metallopeptidase [Psychrosphaera ytuae]QTH63600.1 peptidoglycan DD-metalloendopeptidase family protein [Psychrosphaera ytuae]
MSLTLIYKGKHVRFSAQMPKAQWLPLAAVFLIATVWLIRTVVVDYGDTEQVREQLLTAQQEYSDEKQQLIALKRQAEHQLSALTLKLGEIKGQVNRLDAVASRVAAQANIPAEEFNLEMDSSMGGPNAEQAGDVITDVNTLLEDMEQMLRKLDGQERRMAVLESILMNTHIEEEIFVSGRPIKSGWLSSYYGVRKDPFTSMPAMHKGLDFAGDEGADVVATGAGVVTWADSRFGYGNLVEIDHGDGIITRYGHNKSIEVDVGDLVAKGQTIGKMGSTGRSTGPHVHYEVLKRGKQIDPLPYVYRKVN